MSVAWPELDEFSPACSPGFFSVATREWRTGMEDWRAMGALMHFESLPLLVNCWGIGEGAEPVTSLPHSDDVIGGCTIIVFMPPLVW